MAGEAGRGRWGGVGEGATNMAIIHANTILCAPPVLSLWSSPCIFPSRTNWSLSFTFRGAKDLGGRRAAGADSSCCGCWVSPSLPGAVFGQSRCPHLPARPAGSHGARPRPLAVSGTENKAGALPPHRPALTSYSEYLPVFQGSFPWGQAKQKLLWGCPCPWSDTSSPFIYLLELLPPKSPATERGYADTGARSRGTLSFGTSGLRSMLLERLRFACPCKSGANLLSNFGVKRASPGWGSGRAGSVRLPLLQQGSEMKQSFVHSRNGNNSPQVWPQTIVFSEEGWGGN